MKMNTIRKWAESKGFGIEEMENGVVITINGHVAYKVTTTNGKNVFLEDATGFAIRYASQKQIIDMISPQFEEVQSNVETNTTEEEVIEEVKTPQEKFMNNEKITNVEFLELLNQYGIELNYSLNQWCERQLDAVGLGQYSYRAIGKGMFPKELDSIVEELYEAIKEAEKNNKEAQEANALTIEEATTYLENNSYNEIIFTHQSVNKLHFVAIDKEDELCKKIVFDSLPTHITVSEKVNNEYRIVEQINISN
ncbi:hypothetical protein BEH_07370 [Priestia filamentosa]|uniref:Uncharacterized protein n=1 Tax=Priestia filamentosa TaxID=1402861 RepID=A0A0H4KE91_9BACI|nr:hypothetical protein [Priestia filamentosa]AKO91935.1 hypothetical protein BEH_07370 [Priestia filamentosa]